VTSGRDPIDDAARERWRRVEELVDGALDQPPEARAAWLSEACAGDQALGEEAARILAAGEGEGPLTRVRIADLASALVEACASGAEDTPPPAPERVGPYRVVRLIGHGGMGAVYLAERDDGEFRQTVALKVVRRGLHHDPRALRRFREERQTLAALQHPGIARLLDGGVTGDGLPYFAMERIDGQPIDRFCDERHLTIEERLELFVRVCDAAAHAHRQGIVHRDVKPSNLLVTPDGSPRLLDFGIAKLLQPDEEGDGPAMTRTGERLLTPEYASPEQVRGLAVSPAADVYALGVLLFELLTGQHPFRWSGRTPHDLERATLEDEPSRPSTAVARTGPPTSPGGPDPEAIERAGALRRSTPGRLRQRLRGDLDGIVLQALRKEPERRYPTAAELGADVRRHLDGLPVRARGDSAAYRARVWARRHRKSVVAGAVGVAAGVATIAAFSLRGSGPADVWLEARGLVDSVSTRSPVARRYYEDGLRAYAHGQLGDAVRWFRAALDADSTFAMAAFYGSMAAQFNEDYLVARDLLDRSVRLAGGASERERLLVLTNESLVRRRPTLRAYADSLNARYQSTALGAYWSAYAAFLAGDWPRAVAEAERAVVLDSVALHQALLPCHACDALQLVANAYVMADSMEAAERAAGSALRILPGSVGAWRALAYVQFLRGAPTDSAYRRVVALDPDDSDWAVEWVADAGLRRGDFASADALLRSRASTAPPARVERSMGLLITSLRMQERWDEALTLAREYRSLPEGDAGIVMARHEAQVLLESGRPRASAALFDSISAWRPAPHDASSENRIWHQTHRADALSVAGDTVELAAIADTLRALVPFSGNGRDARLADHVDGLLLAARGDDEAAVEAFRRAVYSWNRGYTRTNLELARALLRLGRGAEAVAALQPALRGSLEVNNSYVTHTALHRVLAEAWRQAGSPDSAAAHDAWVARALAR
jgi:serine/threonine protein kinase/tetratricopeptide (TPR) repeat protein